jgi:hypothetical protein
MKYFTAINKDGDALGVWCRQENYAFKIGIGEPNDHINCHFYIKDGQALDEAMAAQLVAWFKHGEPCVLKEMELKPGQYYERMARTSDQHPFDRMAASCPNLIKFEKQISISKGQLVSLVNRLEDIFQTIHPCDETFPAYGHEIRNLLILACTEVEAQWKGILDTHDYTVNSKHTTNDYVKLKSALRLDEYSVTLPFYPWLPKAHPFKEWRDSNPTQSLEWYSAYHQIKHDREENFDKAQLKHAINAVCACYIMLFAQYGGPETRRGRQEIQNFFNVVDFPNWCPSEVYTYPYKLDHIKFEYEPVTYVFR